MGNMGGRLCERLGARLNRCNLCAPSLGLATRKPTGVTALINLPAKVLPERAKRASAARRIRGQSTRHASDASNGIAGLHGALKLALLEGFDVGERVGLASRHCRRNGPSAKSF